MPRSVCFDNELSRYVQEEIGRRITRARRCLNYTQPQLGVRLGVSYQQVQKYETGESRVSVVALMGIGRALHTDWERLVPSLDEAKVELKRRRTRAVDLRS